MQNIDILAIIVYVKKNMLGRAGLKKMRMNYTKVPNKIFKLGLPVIALSIYFLLISLPEDFNPSLGYIAKSLNITKKTVGKYFGVLISCGLISKLIQGTFKSRSIYKLNPPNQWEGYEQISNS